MLHLIWKHDVKQIWNEWVTKHLVYLVKLKLINWVIMWHYTLINNWVTFKIPFTFSCERILAINKLNCWSVCQTFKYSLDTVGHGIPNLFKSPTDLTPLSYYTYVWQCRNQATRFRIWPLTPALLEVSRPHHTINRPLLSMWWQAREQFSTVNGVTKSHDRVGQSHVMNGLVFIF